MGTSASDELKDIVRLDDGNFIVAGTKNAHCWTIQIDGNGEQLWESEYQFSDQPTYGNALGVLPGGRIIVVGYTLEESKKKMYWQMLSKNGVKISNKVFDTKIVREANDLAILSNGNVGIVGTSFTRKYRENIAVLLLNAIGEQMDHWSLGNKFTQEGFGIVELYNSSLAVSGSSIPNRGDRRTDWCLYNIDLSGNPLIETVVRGGDLNDVAYDVIRLTDGSIQALGYSKKVLHGNAFSTQIQYEELPSSNGLATIDKKKLVLPDGKQILEKGDRGYLEYEVSNSTTEDLYRVEAIMNCSTCSNGGVTIYEKVDVGLIPANSKKKVRIPVKAEETIRDGTNEVSIRLYSFNRILDQQQEKIESQSEPLPRLVISDAVFSFFESDQPERGKPINLKVKVENIGDRVANGIVFRFGLPYKVDKKSESEFKLGEMEPGAVKVLELTFEAQSVYSGSEVKINCSVIESEGKYGERKSYTINLDQGQRPAVKAIDVDEILFSWDEQTEDTLDQETISELKIIVTTNSRLHEDSTKLLQDGESFTGSKFGEVPLTWLSNKPPYKYELKFKDITLELFESSQFEVQVTNVNGISKKSTPIYRTYVPNQPNLYLVSIGVPLDDLRYTTNDAKDFAKAMESQVGEDRPFGKIYKYYFWTADSARAKPISDVFIELARLDEKNRFQKGDFIIVFISSHGTVVDKTLYLSTSVEFDPAQPYRTGIHFKKDIQDKINNISCNKFIFLDACRSGAFGVPGAKDDRNSKRVQRFWEELFKIQSSIKVIASCQPNERSFEDDRWKNGAFTEALLEALGGPMADEDDDGILNSNELFDYLQSRLPEMVKIKSQKIKQNPFMLDWHRLTPVPFYVLP